MSFLLSPRVQVQRRVSTPRSNPRADGQPRSILKRKHSEKYAEKAPALSTGKKEFGFVSVPQVHEFDTDSPSRFHLPAAVKVPVERMDTAELKFHVDVLAPEESVDEMTREEQESIVRAAAVESLLHQLAVMDITSPTDDEENLKLRVNFLNKIQKLSHLLDATGENLSSLSIAELARQLKENHRELVLTSRRETLQDRLASAMLKESNNFRVGCGYDHGLRFMTSDERIGDLSHRELATELKRLGCSRVPRKKVERQELLTDLYEDRSARALQGHFKTVLKNELAVRGMPSDREGLVEHLLALKKMRADMMKRLARNERENKAMQTGQNNVEGRNEVLVSSPSALPRSHKRRRIDEDSEEGIFDDFADEEASMPDSSETQTAQHPIISLEHLPDKAFLESSSIEQLQFEALFAHICINALTDDPKQELSKRNSCSIL